jgi:hypothetical protein
MHEMILTNIMHDESSCVDIGGNWIEADACHVALRFNEDDEEDVEFHMLMSSENLRMLRAWIDYKLAEQPMNLQ